MLAVSLHKAASPGVFFDATLESTELRNVSASVVLTNGWSIKSSSGQSVALADLCISSGGYLTLNVADLGFTPANGARLFLVAPGGAKLRDSQTVTRQLNGTLPGGRWGHPSSPTPGAANVVTVGTAVVINEIFYHAPGSSSEQWVELYNRSGSDVNIGGWKLSDGVSCVRPGRT